MPTITYGAFGVPGCLDPLNYKSLAEINVIFRSSLNWCDWSGRLQFL
jgi:hypothetical protein